MEFYQRRRKGGFEKKICGSISPAAAAAAGGAGTSAKMLHLSFAARYARNLVLRRVQQRRGAKVIVVALYFSADNHPLVTPVVLRWHL